MPLITSVILGVAHNVEHVKENLKGGLPRLVFSLKLEHLHESPDPRMKLGGDNLQVFQEGQLKVRKGKLQPLVNKHSKNGTKHSSKELYILFYGPIRKIDQSRGSLTLITTTFIATLVVIIDGIPTAYAATHL